MRKFYMFLMSMMLFSFAASAQTTVVVNLDSKDRVYVEINGVEVENLKDGDNTIEVPQYTSFYIKSREGSFLTKVVKKSTGTAEYISGLTQCSVYPNAADTWTVTSAPASELRTAKCKVRVDKAENVQAMRSATYSLLELTDGEYVEVAFVPDVESPLQIGPATYGKVLNKVLLNGEAVTSSGSYFMVNVKDGDEVDIVSEFDDVDYKVSFVYTNEGTEDVVKSVSVDGESVTNYNDADFAVKAGKTLDINFDAQNYKIDGLKINGNMVSAYTSYRQVITEETTIEITAHRYAEFTATLTVDNAANIEVRRGYSYSTDFISIVDGKNEIKVSEVAPQIYISAASGANIKKVVAGGAEVYSDYSGGYSINVTDGMEISVESSAMERNATLNVYLGINPTEITYFSMTRADRSTVDLVKGWNEVKFGEDLSIDNPFSWSWYDNNYQTQFGVVTLNGETLAPQYTGSVSYSASFKDGDKLVICPSSETDLSGINAVTIDEAAMPEFVFTITGQKVKSDNLPAGIYIVNGKKVVIR